jgi:predicted nucleic acid-binding protein
MSVYVDTSALAKWYISEVFSEEFERFINQTGQGLISRLAVVEFRCLLARKRRAEEITRVYERRAYRDFERDAKDGYWQIEPVNDGHLLTAVDLIENLKQSPLRTLDAIHLAIAVTLEAGILATADRVMADAASALGIEAKSFF